MIVYNHAEVKYVRVRTPLTDDDIDDYAATIPIEEWGTYEVLEDGVGINGGFFRYLKERNYVKYEEMVTKYLQYLVVRVGIDVDTILTAFNRRFHNTKKAD